MNIYKIWQNKVTGYDTYSEAVVCAENEDEARRIHPEDDGGKFDWDLSRDYEWCDSKDVKVKLIGVAGENVKKGVICASYHAG